MPPPGRKKSNNNSSESDNSESDSNNSDSESESDNSDHSEITEEIKQSYEKTKNEIAKKLSKYYKNDNNWKYTIDDNDIDCLVNWDYYDSDKKTLILAGITRTTTRDKDNKWCATNSNTLPIDRTPPKSTWQSLLGDYGGTAIGIAGKAAAVTATKKLLSTTAGKLLKQKLIGKLRIKILSNIVGKIQSKMISKLSKTMTKAAATRIGKFLAKKFATTIGTNAAKASVKSGLKSGLTSFGKAAAKFKPSPMLAFELLSAGLDILDVGGYGEMQSKKGLYNLKKESDAALRKGLLEETQKVYAEVGETLNEADFIWPIVYDPLENDPESFDSIIDNKLSQILDDPNNELAKPIFEAIDVDLENEKITAADLEDDVVFNKYVDRYLDIESVTTSAFRDWCSSKGGIIYDNDKCTLPKEKCTVWPIPKDSNIQYREFKEGKCVIADSTVRETCDSMGLNYDENTGICTITQDYCKSKGAEWRKNKDINDEYDCIIPVEQQAMEAIFGTTITRGLKQIFDPDQYYGCGYDGAIQIKNKCVDMSGLNNGDRVRIWDCNDTAAQKFYYSEIDQTIRPQMNDRKCIEVKDNKTDNGTAIQINDCNYSDGQRFIYNTDTKELKSKLNNNKCIDLAGGNINNGTGFQLYDCNGTEAQKFNMSRNNITDAGLTCDITYSRLADCPDKGYYNSGFFCQRDPDSIDTGAGRPADCPDGYENQGLTCVRNADTAFLDSGRPADCPDGYENQGLTCVRNAVTRTSDFGLGSYESADCPKGYYNDGTNCTFLAFGRGAGRDDFIYDGWAECARSDGDGDRNNCEKWGARVYPKCQFLARKKGYANADKWTNDACCMCSPVSGYRQFSLNNEGTCPPSNDPSGNYSARHGALCYVDCEKKYGPNFYNNGVACQRDPHSLYVWDNPFKCKDGEFLNRDIGRCYKNCPPGYEHNGSSCYRHPHTKYLWDKPFTCKDGEFLNSDIARCYKNCPDGYTQTGVSCHRPPDTKSNLTCNPDEDYFGGRCYPKCPNGYSDTGLTCHREKARKIALSTNKTSTILH